MRSVSVWARVLGVAETVVEGVDMEPGGAVVVRVRPRRGERRRCGICGRRCRGYDAGEGRRRWRALDLGFTLTYLEAEAPRVSCKHHGVVVARVPWARHGAGFTKSFEEQAAWLATRCAKSAVAELMRVAWRTVGRIITRVVAERERERDLLDGLRRIGIDEISYRRGQRYLIVVVDHDTGRLVWAANGRDEATLTRFFEALGKERCAQITHVSADAASWISNVVAKHCQNAVRCMDPFHVIAWATDALDEVRRQVWNAARDQGQHAQAKDLKGARFALWKNPQDLTRNQQARLSWIQNTNRPLYRAYLLKEQLRQVFQLPYAEALDLLKQWVDWALRSRLPAFVDVAYKIADQIDAIIASLEHRLSNALVESVNTRIRLITRRSFGFHSPRPLIALAMLSLGGLCPPLPGRS